MSQDLLADALKAAVHAPHDALAALVALRGELRTNADAARALARRLPERVAALSPEVSLLFSEVAAELAPYGPRLPTDTARLVPRLRIAWARTALVCGAIDEVVALDDAGLLAVVAGFSLGALPMALPVFRRLGAARDARLRQTLLSSLAAAVEHLAVTPEVAFDGLLPLVDDVEPRLRIAALELVREPWLRRLSSKRARDRDLAVERALTSAESPVANAAVVTAGHLGLHDLLATVLDDDAPSALGAEVMARLAPVADATDLDRVVALMNTDTLRYGGPARLFLLEAHRHGTFLRESHLEAVLTAFDAHRLWSGEELVRLTHIARTNLIRVMEPLDADDPRWRRRAAILAASPVVAASELLRQKLVQVTDDENLSAFVDAAGRAAFFADEEALLGVLPRVPAAAITALRYKGSLRSVGPLDRLARDPFTPSSLRSLAMATCWAHAEDRPALLAGWVAALGPREGGLLSGRFVARRDAEGARLVCQRLKLGLDADLSPLDALRLLAESGDVTLLPEVSRLFREVFRHYVTLALAGDFTVKRVRMPELEQLVFRYGRQCITDGRVIRRWNDDAPETGRDLVLSLVCDWLREEPSEAIAVALLETAGRHAPTGAWLRALETFWRHPNASVQRAAVEAILGAGAGARGLELSLCRLAASSEPRVTVQALAAVRALRASWAEPIVVRALERPEMAVKKEAAEALAEIGTASSLAAIVHWLARHDNASFRAPLKKACGRVAGPSLVAVLVEALEADGREPRERELLHDALSGHITLVAVARLAQSPRPARQEVVEACIDGRIAVVGATPDDVAAALHRAGLRPAPKDADPTLALRTLGFSPERARAVVEARGPHLDARLLAAVRQSLPDWLRWLKAEPTPSAIALVVDAIDRSHAELFDDVLDILQKDGAGVEPAHVAALCERVFLTAAPHHRARALAVFRAARPSPTVDGRRRYRMLQALGAVRTLTDLEACLAACRLGPDFAGESERLLAEAFDLPPKAADEHGELVRLRDGMRAYARLSDAAAGEWLLSTQAARPLDVAFPPSPVAPLARQAFAPDSRASLEALVVTLRSAGADDRTRAAARILAWEDARAAWGDVLESFLAGDVELEPSQRAKVASCLGAWPDPSRHGRALLLVPHLSTAQVRGFLPQWLAEWRSGSGEAELTLRALGNEPLLAWAYECAKDGDFRGARLLVRDASLALAAIVELGKAHAPKEIAHLLPPLPEDRASRPSGDPQDPVAGQDFEALVRLATDRHTERGLAVRAVHALGHHGEAAAAPLARLALDRRPEVRSAALRVLKTVSSREEALRVATEVLAMETRVDVVLSLMASLGHGRHGEALPLLVTHLTGPSVRLQGGARDALRAWGREAIPLLRRAARRARPDRRRRIEAVLRELEG